MNKQEVMKKLTDAKRLFRPCRSNDYARDGFEEGINFALETVYKLDEPEKPEVPQFVADWYEEHKINFEFNLYRFCVDFHESELPENLHVWFISKNNRPIQTLVNMHQFGYEVEKEKLYTVKFSNNNFGTIYIGIIKSANKIGLSTLPMNDKYSKCHFTESELKELKFWDNPAFEIEEVKGE